MFPTKMYKLVLSKKMLNNYIP